MPAALASAPPASESPIRRARQQAGKSLRDLGGQTGIAFQKIWLLENGLRASSMELRLLAAALNVPVDSLR